MLYLSICTCSSKSCIIRSALTYHKVIKTLFPVYKCCYVVFYLFLLTIRKNEIYKLMWWLYKVRYDTICYYDMVGYSSSDVTSGAVMLKIWVQQFFKNLSYWNVYQTCVCLHYYRFYFYLTNKCTIYDVDFFSCELRCVIVIKIHLCNLKLVRLLK
jgi:hypothetical protein